MSRCTSRFGVKVIWVNNLIYVKLTWPLPKDRKQPHFSSSCNFEFLSCICLLGFGRFSSSIISFYFLDFFVSFFVEFYCDWFYFEGIWFPPTCVQLALVSIVAESLLQISLILCFIVLSCVSFPGQIISPFLSKRKLRDYTNLDNFWHVCLLNWIYWFEPNGICLFGTLSACASFWPGKLPDFKLTCHQCFCSVFGLNPPSASFFSDTNHERRVIPLWIVMGWKMQVNLVIVLVTFTNLTIL